MRLGKQASVFGLILFGTTTSLFAKIVYELNAEGRDGKHRLFQKPWAMTTVMFIGMSFCLPVAWLKERQDNKNRELDKDLEQPLLQPQASTVKKGGVKETLLLAIPSFFDLVATVLMNVGLLSVTASVYQMMRGAEMLFAALFAITFLRRSLNRFHGLGIFCCVVGIGLVGTASLGSGEGSSTHEVSPRQILVGMALIVASQAVQAAQLTFEDFFMADLEMEPLKIVGFEGVFGTLLMVGLLLPVAQFLPGAEGRGLHEDSLDTLAMIRNTPALQVVLGVQMAALLLYNISGMMVTNHLGAVFRTVLETMRTLFVWLLGLLLFYTPLGMGRLGESWSNWSYLQAAGFAVLVCGTLVYNKGDEMTAKAELSSAVTDALAVEPAAAGAGEQEPLQQALGVADGLPRPIPPPPSQPTYISIARPASLKASMTMSAGSYSRSYTGRSLPRASLPGN